MKATVCDYAEGWGCQGLNLKNGGEDVKDGMGIHHE